MNDVTVREDIWRRFAGDDWACFDALPSVIRRRLHEHAYDAWSVNALILWRRFKYRRGSTARAALSLLRYLDECETIERAEFAMRYQRAYKTPLPHVAACASVVRYGSHRRNELH